MEKFLKSNPDSNEELAEAAIVSESACIYEAFVRRRGKGKKTIEKEKEEHLGRDSLGLPSSGWMGSESQSRSGSSEFESAHSSSGSMMC